MTISVSLSFLIFIFIAIIVASATITYYIIRQNKHKIERKSNNMSSIIQIYREKETVLRTWYSIIVGVDTMMLLLSILSNAGAILLSLFENINQETIISCMIVSLVSTSIRDAFNLSNLRKPYIKATRHLELEIDACEYTHNKTEEEKASDLCTAYFEAQKIIETYFE